MGRNKCSATLNVKPILLSFKMWCSFSWQTNKAFCNNLNFRADRQVHLAPRVYLVNMYSSGDWQKTKTDPLCCTKFVFRKKVRPQNITADGCKKESNTYFSRGFGRMIHKKRTAAQYFSCLISDCRATERTLITGGFIDLASPLHWDYIQAKWCSWRFCLTLWASFQSHWVLKWFRFRVHQWPRRHRYYVKLKWMQAGNLFLQEQSQTELLRQIFCSPK